MATGLPQTCPEVTGSAKALITNKKKKVKQKSPAHVQVVKFLAIYNTNTRPSTQKCTETFQ